MKIYWIFLILAILCAIFSNRIDMLVKDYKSVKILVIILSVVLFFINIISLGKAII